VLSLLWVFGTTNSVSAQTYTDSTIVYLEYMSDPLRTVMINWIEEEDLESIEVHYRIRGSSDPWLTTIGSQISIPDVPVNRKTVQLTNLTPNSSYEFRIKADTISHNFRTLPATLDTRVRFIVTGDVYGDGVDPALDTELFEEISVHAAALRPHFAVLAGDIVHLPVDDRYDVTTVLRTLKFLYEWYTHMVTPQGELIPIIAGLGNHETPMKFGGDPEDAVYFNALFNFPGIQGYRVLDFANYLSLIVLNTDHTRRIEGAQTTWLQSRLAERTNVTNVFPIYHVPAYPSRRDAIPGRGLEVLQNWVPLFEQYNVRFAFEHDNHAYKRTFPIRNNEISPCGVRYIGDGGFAYATGPVDTTKWYIQQHWNARHFNVVEVSATKRSVSTIAFTGAEIDGFSQNTMLVPPEIQPASNVGSSSFTANWGGVCVANQYRIDVSSDPNFSTFLPGYQNFNAGNNFSLNITGLNPSTTYYYRVRAVDTTKGTTSGNSNSTSVITSTVPPVASPATNVSINTFTANWQFVSGANQYRIDVATDQQFQNILPAYNDLNAGNVATIEVTGVNSATTYYYRVRARNTNLNLTSANSGLIGLITRPEIPQLLPVASLTSNSFMIRWNPVPRVDQYRLDVSTQENFSTYVDGYQNFIVSNAISHTITGLNPQTRYYFRLRSRSSTLEVTSDYSQVGNAITLPEVPQNITAINQTSGSFILNWDKVNNTDTYLLDIALNPQFTQFIPEYNNRNVGDVNSFEVMNLSPQTVYYVRIRARNTGSNLTSISSPSYIAATLPPTPENLAVSDLGPRYFSLTWDPIDGIDEYLLDLSLSPTFESYIEGFEDFSAGDKTDVEITGLLPSFTYYFRIRSVNNALEVISKESNTGTITTLPDAPSDLQISTIRSQSAVLTWAENETANQYYIDVSESADFIEYVNGYENYEVGNTLSYLIDNLTQLRTYYVRVRVKNQTTELTSFNSDVLEFITIPSTPNILQASNITAVRFTANWNQVENVSTYLLDVAIDDQFQNAHQNYIDYSVGDVDKFELTALEPGQTYFYRVRALSESLNLRSEYSETAEVKTIAVDLNTSTMDTDKSTLLADGETFSTLVVTIRDSNNQPLNEVNVQLFANSGTSEIEVVQGQTNVDGKAIFIVTNLTAERVTYSAAVNDNVLNQTVTVDFTPVSPIFSPFTNIRASTFTLNWEPVAGAMDYKLDVSSDENFTSFVDAYANFSTGDVNSYQVTGLISRHNILCQTSSCSFNRDQ
jgi:acid phosphatase type 7